MLISQQPVKLPTPKLAVARSCLCQRTLNVTVSMDRRILIVIGTFCTNDPPYYPAKIHLSKTSWSMAALSSTSYQRCPQSVLPPSLLLVILQPSNEMPRQAQNLPVIAFLLRAGVS